MPINIDTIIDISDPVYSFCEIIDHTDLTPYFAEEGCRTGRPRYDQMKLLKVILFSFMEEGNISLRSLAHKCCTDIRYMWLLDGMKAPSFMTFSNFIRNVLSGSIEDIFFTINRTIFGKDHVDLQHVYLDGTKIEANANKYTWVWKKSCIRSRDKVFAYTTELIEEINRQDLAFQNVSFETRSEYAVEYLDLLLEKYLDLMQLNPMEFVHGRGHRKTQQQRRYEKLKNCRDRLAGYAEHIGICGDRRNSYSKTDHDATFMRVKRDYMGNDQLLPAYNMQTAVCDEYIAVMDVLQYASDMDCFEPVMRKFEKGYGFYPEYPVADAGYGSLNNYIFCEENGMKKFMKFPMYAKTVKDESYREDPFRAVNFDIDGDGNPVCPAGRRFLFLRTQPVKGNRYGRTEEVYQCEDCSGCELKGKCCPKAKNSRTVRINRELTSMHEEVLENLRTIHGALLCMNRSIQAEGTFGGMKWNRRYKRAVRRGIEDVMLEFTLIACGYNLYKYHNRKKRMSAAA